MKATIGLLLLFCLFCQGLMAQNETAVENIIQDIFEQYTAETDESIDYESFYNDLNLLLQTPIVINSATREELEKLPFLTDIQIENILAFIYKNKHLNSLFELQLVDGLDMTDVRRILPFVTLGDRNVQPEKMYWNEIWRYGKSNLMFRLDKTAELKAGYQPVANDSGIMSTPYLGKPFYNSLKYNFSYKNRLDVGVVMEKDAGEQFWGSTHKGYDSYSAHVQLNDFWKFKTIVVGDYRASFGQGLVFNSGYGSAKSSYVLNVINRTNGLKKFSSTDEYNFFRGLGATLNIAKAELTCFLSSRKIDADTTEQSLSSIYKTGLHRTSSEFQKKHTVGVQTLGFNMALPLSNARVGVTVSHTMLSQQLYPPIEPYNLKFFRGQKLSTASIDYRYRLHGLHFFGETAFTSSNGVATVNGIAFAPLSTVSFITLWRYYSPKYDTFYANAFAENSRINNENGLYIGAEIRPFSKWRLAIYADSYQFPWLKYGVHSPSTGQDYLLQADFVPKRNLQMIWRIKYEQKQKNSSVGPILVPYNFDKASFRYQLSYTSGGFSSKNLLELSYTDSLSQQAQWGFVAYQDLSYKFEKPALTLNARCMFFDAPNYDNRFYLYEKDILYAFSIPLIYGTGVRYYLNLKLELFKRTTLWFKVAQTVYEPTRKSIGSGLETIQGNRRTDFRLLLKHEF